MVFVDQHGVLGVVNLVFQTETQYLLGIAIDCSVLYMFKNEQEPPIAADIATAMSTDGYRRSSRSGWGRRRAPPARMGAMTCQDLLPGNLWNNFDIRKGELSDQ